MAEQVLELEGPFGRLTVREDVVATLVAKALEKVEGVRPLRGGGGILGIFSGPEEGLRLTLGKGSMDLELRIGVVLGYPVHEVAQGVQQAVREDLEGLTGVRVGRVDVYVKQVIPPEEVLVLEEGKEGENGE